MIVFLAILQNAIQAGVDIMDKFLITKRRIEPVSYTFYTIVTGAVILALWPWTYASLPAENILLNIGAGVLYTLALYVFFRALCDGEVTRVVPFIFGLLPVFDLLLSSLLKSNALATQSLWAISLLVPGALLISFRPGKYLHKHLFLKILAALLLSCHNLLWNYAAQEGPVLNNFMWNRVGAAGILVLLLLVPYVRKKVLTVNQIPQRSRTSFLFIVKQLIGGSNFIFLSYLLALGNVVVVDSLLGFRYAFLFLFGLVLSFKFKHVLDEDTSRYVIYQKILAIILIFLGTVLLFVR